jgi:hypothetical protein
MYTPCGLYYFFVDRNIPLPLLHVHAVANIKELAAHVKLTHTYANDTAFALEATYSFPIPARAAVCSFVMIKEDGTRVIGHVQEKGEAREIYASAVVQGKQAALMEQQTPDGGVILFGFHIRVDDSCQCSSSLWGIFSRRRRFGLSSHMQLSWPKTRRMILSDFIYRFMPALATAKRRTRRKINFGTSCRLFPHNPIF